MKRLYIILVLIGSISCGALITPKLNLSQYSFDLRKSKDSYVSEDYTVSLEIIKPSEIYNYPQFFSFVIEELPNDYQTNFVKQIYLPDTTGLSWEYIFGDYPGENLLNSFVLKIQNNKDDSIFITNFSTSLNYNSSDSIVHIQSLEDLTNLLDSLELEAKFFKYFDEMSGYPLGLYETILLYNKDNIQLYESRSYSIPPDSSLKFLLIYPPNVNSNPKVLKISYDYKIGLDDSIQHFSKVYTMYIENVELEIDFSSMRWIFIKSDLLKHP